MSERGGHQISFFPKFKIVHIILGGGVVKKIIDFFHIRDISFWNAQKSTHCVPNVNFADLFGSTANAPTHPATAQEFLGGL